MKCGDPFLPFYKTCDGNSPINGIQPIPKNLLHTNVAVGIWEKAYN